VMTIGDARKSWSATLSPSRPLFQRHGHPLSITATLSTSWPGSTRPSLTAHTMCVPREITGSGQLMTAGDARTVVRHPLPLTATLSPLDPAITRRALRARRPVTRPGPDRPCSNHERAR